MVNEARLVELFQKLCLINAPALAERDVVDWTKKLLEDLGLEVMEDNAGAEIGGNAGNVIAKLPANQSGLPRIFLSAHFDTVEPTAGLVIEERYGVFYSASDTILGADDKGGMAPAIEAVTCLIESGEPHGDIYLLFTVSEEIGLKGAAALNINELELDFGYVLDTGPPVGTFVNKTAFHDSLEIYIKGKPAHSGKFPEEGISAIQVMADAISGMKLGRIGPETTANIGLVEGGTAVNVVCPFVKLKGEARSTSADELKEQVDHMMQRFEEAGRKWGAGIDIKHSRHYAAYEIPATHPCLHAAVNAAKEMGFSGDLRTTLGGSDANVFNAKGVPCIVVATGMDKIHTHDEFISRKDLVDTAALTLRLIQSAMCETGL